WRSTAVTATRVPTAERRCSASSTPRTRPTTVLPARRAAGSWRTAHCHACFTTTGRGRSRSWRSAFPAVPGARGRRRPRRAVGGPGGERAAGGWRARKRSGKVADMTPFWSVLLLGFFLGMRHATDPDHVIAVSTIVSRQRSVRGAAWTGVLWGIGHTLTILAVGGAIIAFGLVIPPHVCLGMEFSLAVM